MTKRSFYMASGLENATEVKTLAAPLKQAGWSQTYDWTTHGSVQKEEQQRISEVAVAELQGVLDCSVLIVVLPGGRGTHTELGAALACGKPVILYAKHRFALHGSQGAICAFYLHPNVKITHDRDQLLPMAELALGK